MIENPRRDEEDTRYQNYTADKDLRNLFRLEKEIKAIKDRILRDNEILISFWGD